MNDKSTAAVLAQELFTPRGEHFVVKFPQDCVDNHGHHILCVRCLNYNPVSAGTVYGGCPGTPIFDRTDKEDDFLAKAAFALRDDPSKWEPI